MNSPLRVLHLEDAVRDTELVQASLEGEGIRSELTRVEREQDFLSALKRRKIRSDSRRLHTSRPLTDYPR